MSDRIKPKRNLRTKDRIREAFRRAEEKTERGGLADSTLAAYERSWQDFCAWCEDAGATPLPAAPEVVRTYLEDIRSERGLVSGSLRNYVSAIGWYHDRARETNPTKDTTVQRYLSACASEDAARVTNEASPLTTSDIKDLLRPMGKDMSDLRDRALILVGYSAALRVSELVQMDREHLQSRGSGYVLTVPRQKNDQTGEGQKKGIPRTGRALTCPATALDRWLGEIPKEGPVFRSLGRWNSLGGRMSRQACSYILKKRLKAAGIDPTPYSMHSLRAGFMTQVAQSGESLQHAMLQSGHQVVNVAQWHVPDARVLQNPALQALDL
jgi:site-specific recombinase XerD